MGTSLTAKLTAKSMDTWLSQRTTVDTITSLTRHYGRPRTPVDGLLLHGMEEVRGSIPLSSTPKRV